MGGRVTKLHKFSFDLSRTLVQSASLTIEARTEHEAEEIVADILERGDDPVAVLGGQWSEGEVEGSIDYDFNGEVKR
jgi:hypothetical protein